MMAGDGRMALCRLSEVGEDGMLPVQKLIAVDTFDYAERSLGYNRVYTAMGANSQADRVVRTWPIAAEPGMYAVEDGAQWRVNVVQRVEDDGLPVLDLTLARTDSLLDVEEP